MPICLYIPNCDTYLHNTFTYFVDMYIIPILENYFIKPTMVLVIIVTKLATDRHDIQEYTCDMRSIPIFVVPGGIQYLKQ